MGTLDGRCYWLAVPEFFLDHYAEFGLSPGEAMFVIHLLRHKQGGNDICPKMQSLADRMGMSYSQIRKYSVALQKHGYLHRRLRKGKTCVFDLRLLCEKLEARRREIEAAELARVRHRGGHGHG